MNDPRKDEADTDTSGMVVADDPEELQRELAVKAEELRKLLKPED